MESSRITTGSVHQGASKEDWAKMFVLSQVSCCVRDMFKRNGEELLQESGKVNLKLNHDRKHHYYHQQQYFGGTFVLFPCSLH